MTSTKTANIIETKAGKFTIERTGKNTPINAKSFQSYSAAISAATKRGLQVIGRIKASY